MARTYPTQPERIQIVGLAGKTCVRFLASTTITRTTLGRR